ncbi:hypothetical protein [Neisseria meningitidis]|uniref:hypothetical protein n=1 Tax=Neisseria meningitidis TaxID=487 RepID=UPI0012960C72|nr:hypothetical protein [Neisseria meningitidis]
MEVTRNLKQAKPNEPDSRLRGNDEFQVAVLVFYFCENNGISACGYLPEKQKPLRRHSRAGGNLDIQC